MNSINWFYLSRRIGVAGILAFVAIFKGWAPSSSPAQILNNPVPAALAATTPIDTCGYPFSSGVARTNIVFNEDEVLVDFDPKLGGPAASGTRVKLWYSDEHAMTLGVRQSSNGTFSVSQLSSNPGVVNNPQVGDPNATDPSGRPMFPSLFITDITSNPTSKAGDWQYGGTAIAPHAVYGTWKAAVSIGTTVTPDADPAKNNWNLGSGSDAPPSGTASQGYGTEVVWNVDQLPLTPGHSYRFQFMVHDGDQNKTGGDVGEGCTTIISPTPTPTPTSPNTPTFTPSPTNTRTNTPTNTPVLINTPTFTPTPTNTPTNTPVIPGCINGKKVNPFNTGLPGWTILLSWTEQGGQQSRTTVTDIGGNFVFNNLTPGLPYIISEIPQPGWTPAGPTSYNMNVTPGQNCGSVTFINIPPTPTPTNTVPPSPTPTGTRTPDNTPTPTNTSVTPGCIMGTKQDNTGHLLSNWVILATWTDPILGQQSRTTLTDANGAFQFNNLTPGLIYNVSEILQPGWTALTPLQWTMMVNSGATCGSVVFVNQPPATPTPTPTNTRVNAPTDTPTPTNTPIVLGCINGTKINPQSVGVPNWTILIAWTDPVLGQQSRSTTTNASGLFQFDNLTPGVLYTVSEVLQSGWTAITPMSYVTNVTPGQNCSYLVFLNQPPSTPVPTPTNTPVVPTPTPTNTPQLGRVCALVWFDQNANAVRDGEPLLNNALITLKDSNNVVLGTRLTNGTEPYCVDNLQPGNYTVTENNPNGYTSTTPDLVATTVVLGGTQNIQFGDTLPPTPTPTNTRVNVPTDTPTPTNTPIVLGCINGTKINPQSVGVPNWTILIAWTDPVLGQQSRSTTTNASGLFQFNNLTPGLLYTVSEVLQSGWTAITPLSYVTNVMPGQECSYLVFLNQPPSTPVPTPTNTPVVPTPTPTTTPQLGRVCSLVWFDQNANAVRDGEPLLNNALITLKDSNNVVLGTRLTNGTEPYCVDNLQPGNYTVTENNPNGYTSTTPDSVVTTVVLGGTQNVQFGDTLPPTPTPTNTPIVPTFTPTNTPTLIGCINGNKYDPQVHGLPGWTILLNWTDPILGQQSRVATTDSSGFFQFNNLMAGVQYTVSEVNQAGWTPITATSWNVNVTPNQCASVVFLNQPPSTPVPTPTNTPVVPTPTPTNTPLPPRGLCALVWFDQNVNTVRDAGEPLLTNALITVKDPNGVVVGTRMTNGTEPYCIYNLQPGAYTVTENNPNGYVSTTPDSVVTFPSSDAVPVVQFGDALPTPTPTNTRVNEPTATPTPTNTPVVLGCINGFKYDPQVHGLPGWTILLNWTDPTLGQQSRVATTDSSGFFQFSNLVPSLTYTVSEVNQAGWTPITTTSWNVSVSPNQCAGVVFLNQPPSTPVPTPTNTPVPPTPTPTSTPHTGGLCALVWFDQNANTVRDAGEPLLNNALVTMKDSNGVVVGTHLTDGTEPFCLDNLPAGTYTVTENNPAGYISTTPDLVVKVVGSVATVQFGDTLPPTPTPTNTPVPPTPTPTNTPQLGRLCQYVWFDQNGNTVRDAGEPLLTNALVTIKDPNGAVINARLTNGTEPYCLDNLPPGNYTVTENNPNGYVSTTPDQVVIAVTSGGVQTAPFGDTLPPTPTPTPTNTPQLGRLCAFAWLDQNANAVRDSGEPLLSNSLLTMKDPNGAVIGTRLTNGTEPWCVDNLPPGNYTVTENNPNGYVSTTPDLVTAIVTYGTTQTVPFGDTLPPTPTPTPSLPPPFPVNEPKSMVSDPLRNRLYIADHIDGTVTVWDEVNQRVLTTIATGPKPVGVDIVNDRVFVGNNGNQTVSVINASTMTKMTDIKLNDQRAEVQCFGGPQTVAVHPGLNRVYVALFEGRVAVIDATSNALIECISTNSGTTAVAVDPNRNRMYVTNRVGQDLQVFNIGVQPAQLVQDIRLNGVPYFGTVDPVSGKVFVTVAFDQPDYLLANNLLVYNSDGNILSLQTTKVVGNTYDGGHLWVSKANGMLYIAALQDNVLQIYDPNTQSLGLRMPMQGPYGIAENLSLGRMYIGNRDFNTVSVVSDNLR